MTDDSLGWGGGLSDGLRSDGPRSGSPRSDGYEVDGDADGEEHFAGRASHKARSRMQRKAARAGRRNGSASGMGSGHSGEFGGSGKPGKSGRGSRVSHVAAPISDSLNDPLVSHPRVSSVVLCVVLGLASLALAAFVWWATARTVKGQEFDDLVITHFHGRARSGLNSAAMFSLRAEVWVAVAIAIVALVLLIVRKRWGTLLQSVVFVLLSFAAVRVLKAVLPRPRLIQSRTNSRNSAPSGHTTLILAAMMVLLFAVPLAWRAVVAIVGWILSSVVGVSLVEQMWHRPSDILVAVLIVTGLALLTLGTTWGSAMDPVGRRRSSPAIQIVSTLLMTLGACACLYSCYLIVQVAPGLDTFASWTHAPAIAAAQVMIVGAMAVSFGLVCAFRQLTASPLSAVGLVGAPPKPRRR